LYKPIVGPNTSSVELFEIMDKALTLLNDGHLNIHTPHGIGGNTKYFSVFPENPVVAQPDGPYFEYYHVINRQMSVGKIKNSGLSYLRIKTFDGREVDFARIDSVLHSLVWSSGLIIDVRSNYGGSIGNAESVASKFLKTTSVAYEYRIRNGPRHSDFTPWYPIEIIPSPAPGWAEKQVVILTNRGSFSATEWFVLFMKRRPGVAVVGDTTGGGGAIPITRELPNGWILRIPNTQTRLPSGEFFQSTGIAPDVPVWLNDEDQANGVDTILESAITLF
jgi:C-terminal processing protease CtpA/Prc